MLPRPGTGGRPACFSANMVTRSELAMVLDRGDRGRRRGRARLGRFRAANRSWGPYSGSGRAIREVRGPRLFGCWGECLATQDACTPPSWPSCGKFMIEVSWVAQGIRNAVQAILECRKYRTRNHRNARHLQRPDRADLRLPDGTGEMARPVGRGAVHGQRRRRRAESQMGRAARVRRAASRQAPRSTAAISRLDGLTGLVSGRAYSRTLNDVG